MIQGIEELMDEPVVLDPGGRETEERKNTWSIANELADPPDGPGLEETLFRLSVAWLARARRDFPRVRAATFYAWYDAQAGHLRLSLTSLPASQLPFGAVVVLVDSPRRIVQQILADSTPGLITWDDLAPVPESAWFDRETDVPRALEVWASTLSW
jgi:hypothetical protein